MKPEESAPQKQGLRAEVVVAIVTTVGVIAAALIQVLPDLLNRPPTPAPANVQAVESAAPASTFETQMAVVITASAPTQTPASLVPPTAAAIAAPTAMPAAPTAPIAATTAPTAAAAGARITAANAAQLVEARVGQPFGSPYGLALSPDGATLIVATAFQGEVYDYRALREPLYDFGEAAAGPMGSVALAPDGRTIALGTAGRPPVVELYDLARGLIKIHVLEGHTQGVVDLAFSPDSRRVASASRDGSVRIWDVASGKQLFREMAGGDRGVASITFSPDGERIVAGGGDGQVRVWTMEGGKPEVTLPVGEFDVTDVTFSPDGRLLATTYLLGEAITLWDTVGWEPDIALRGHVKVAGEGVYAAAFSGDGTLLASGGKDLTVRVWDVAPASPSYGKLLVTLEGHSDWPQAVLFAPDGTALLSASERDGTIRVWQVAGE
jgi:WD40 repeat protein